MEVIESGILAKAAGNTAALEYFVGDGTSASKIGKSVSYVNDGAEQTDIYRMVKDGKVYISSVLTNIPSANYTTDFTFRAYIVLRLSDSSEVVAYGDEYTENIAHVAYLIQNSTGYDLLGDGKAYIDSVAAYRN